MTRLEQVGNYEKAVVDFMINGLSYSEKEAESTVRGYYSVIERIGFFDNPKDWALKLDEAMRYNITPDMWHNVL